MISFIIPVYNEERIIAKTLETLIKLINESELSTYEILLSDNDSDDKTEEICRYYEDKYKQIHYIYTEKRGVGFAIKNAWKHSKGDYICTMDADLSASPAMIIGFIEKLEKEQVNMDIVNFSRYAKRAEVYGRKPHRQLMSRILNVIVSCLFGRRITDIMSGFQVIKRASVEANIPFDIVSNKWFWSGEIIILGIFRHLQIDEQPTHWIEDNESKVNIMKTVIEYAVRIIYLKWLLIKGV